MTLLHTGKVLAFGGSGNDPAHLKNPFPPEIFNPNTGEVYSIPHRFDGDIFCAGHSFLADGRLLVSGGTYRYDRTIPGMPIAIPPFRGLEQSYIFDPDNETWQRVEDMSHGRWYPTLVTLGDGSVLCMAGLTKRLFGLFLSTIEKFSPASGWEKVKHANRWLPLYPRLHLLPSGEVFYSGSYNTHMVYPFKLGHFPTATLDMDKLRWDEKGDLHRSQREEGASVLLPLVSDHNYQPKIALIGGGTTTGTRAYADVEIMDFSETKPRWRNAKQSMTNQRYYAYAVLLPNKEVLVVGGRKGTIGHHDHLHGGNEGHLHGGFESGSKLKCEVAQDEKAIREPEMFDTEKEAWRPMAPMNVDRLYHSNALLLPDGRVLVAGSNPERTRNELCIEVFRPPYLCSDHRPEIEDSPAEISYGNSFESRTHDASQIRAVALMRPSATTHCVDTEQRYVGLDFDVKKGKIVAVAPGNPNIAPPGYYMLFIIDEEGIPSRANFLHLS